MIKIQIVYNLEFNKEIFMIFIQL